MLIESTKNRRFICLNLKRERTSIWIDQDTILSVMELESGGICVVYAEHVHKFAVDVDQLHGDIIASITSPRIKPPSKRRVTDHEPLMPLDPLYYNEDRVMISHAVVPMNEPSEGVFWCRICGGHPSDPIHRPGWES